MTNKDLKRRIIEISHKKNLSHIGSCLTAVDIIDEIFQSKKPDEKFVLSSGHAGLALYVVLEKYLPLTDAEYLFDKHGVHPNRDVIDGIDCSSGSLGQGLPIAVGMALADRTKNVYCLISDGECAEGSIWEALRIWKEQKLTNLKVYVNWNNWAAYRSTEEQMNLGWYGDILKENYDVALYKTSVEQLPFLNGQDAHYAIMSKDQYEEAMRILSD